MNSKPDEQADGGASQSWMSVEEARAAYPNVFTSEGRPAGQLDALLDFLSEIDAVIAPIPKHTQTIKPQNQKEKPDGAFNR